MAQLFSHMTADEQSQYQQSFEAYLSSLDTNTPDVQQMEKGLSLLEAFPYCRGFITDTLRFRDFIRRFPRFLYYIDKVKRDIARATPSTTLVTSKAAEKAHVGRPTKAEAVERRAKAAEQKAALDAITTTAFPEQTDVQMLQGRIHLDQISWVLSPALQEKVASLRQLRTAFATASEDAKRLAELGKPETEVSEQATRANQLNADIEGIYGEVDNEVAELIIRLHEDDKCIATYKDKVSDMKAFIALLKTVGHAAELVDSLTPSVLAKIADEQPEAVAAKEAEKEKQARVRAIVKYLTRTDKPATAKRIETMTARLEELHDLIGSEADAYQAVLTKTKEDYQASLAEKKKSKKKKA